jgi:hypothetical protein
MRCWLLGLLQFTTEGNFQMVAPRRPPRISLHLSSYPKSFANWHLQPRLPFNKLQKQWNSISRPSVGSCDNFKSGVGACRKQALVL